MTAGHSFPAVASRPTETSAELRRVMGGQAMHPGGGAHHSNEDQSREQPGTRAVRASFAPVAGHSPPVPGLVQELAACADKKREEPALDALAE